MSTSSPDYVCIYPFLSQFRKEILINLVVKAVLTNLWSSLFKLLNLIVQGDFNQDDSILVGTQK